MGSYTRTNVRRKRAQHKRLKVLHLQNISRFHLFEKQNHRVPRKNKWNMDYKEAVNYRKI